MRCYKEEEDYDYYDEDDEECEDGDLNEEGVPMVKLIGTDGNSFALLGKVRQALKRAGMSDKIDQMTKEATSGDRDNLLQVLMQYCDVR